MQDLDSEALDRYITGNYGDDFFRHHAEDEPSAESMMDEPPDEISGECSGCGQSAEDHVEVTVEAPDGNEYSSWECPEEA